MEMLLLLGGNIGDVSTTLALAEGRIRDRIGPVLSRSRDHWTEPWGFTDERLFLNRALLIDTERTPEDVLRLALAIELELGRTREDSGGYSSRTIDIDVLLCGEMVISSPELTVPHPRLHERAFALAPSADVAPDWSHPLLHRTVLTLLNDVLCRA